jgi:hypothetical protein
MTTYFASDDFGLVEPSLAGSLWRRRCPGQHWERPLIADAVINQSGERWSKRPSRRPFAVEFEIGDEGTRHVVVGNEARNGIKVLALRHAMRRSEICSARRTG